MKLLELVVRELKNWPDKVTHITQSGVDSELYFQKKMDDGDLYVVGRVYPTDLTVAEDRVKVLDDGQKRPRRVSRKKWEKAKNALKAVTLSVKPGTKLIVVKNEDTHGHAELEIGSTVKVVERRSVHSDRITVKRKDGVNQHLNPTCFKFK